MRKKALQGHRSAGRENNPPQFRRGGCQDYRSQRAETYPSIPTGKPHCDPNKNEATTRLASNLAADGSGRPFDMVKDDVLLAWQQSPHKDTLGFYGVGSPTHQPESVVFNQVVAACLVKVNGGGTQRRVSKQAKKSFPRDMLAEKNHIPQNCKPFILNRQALQSDLQQIPHVQQQLDPRKAFEVLYCPDSPQVTRDSTRVARHLYTGISRDQVFDMEPARRKDPRGLRRRHWYCPPDCLEPRQPQHEWPKNKLDPHPLNKEFRNCPQEKEEHKSTEPINYDHLYSRILKCFEQKHCPDPLCEPYEKCCKPKRSHGKDNQGGGDSQIPRGDLGDPTGEEKRETGEDGKDKVTGVRDEGTVDKEDGKDKIKITNKKSNNDGNRNIDINTEEDIYTEKERDKDIVNENAKQTDKKRHQEPDKRKEKVKKNKKEKYKEREKKRGKENEKNWEREREKENKREKKKEKESERGREMEKEREVKREQDKEKRKEKEKERKREGEQREHEKEKDKEIEKEKQRDKEMIKEIDREIENRKRREKESRKEKEREKEKDMKKEHEKEKEIEKEKEEEKEEKGKGQEKEKESEKEIEKGKKKGNGKEREKGKDVNKEKVIEKKKDREIGINKDKERNKFPEKGKEKNKEEDIEYEKDDLDKYKNQNKKKNKIKISEDIKNEVDKVSENKEGNNKPKRNEPEEPPRFSEMERRKTQPEIPSEWEHERPSKRGTSVDEYEFPALEIVRNEAVVPTCKLKVPPKRKKRNREKNFCKDTPKKTCPPCPPAGCQCEICNFMDRPYNEREAPFMREMRRAEQRRQLRTYYRQMCHQELIRDRRRPEYRAPNHQCDPICCSNFLCQNPRLAEHCDCLGAVQELQNLLSDAKDNEDHSRLLLRVDNLRKRVCQRMCDSILA
ncbi:zinc finger CCCH domain-containing protein 13 [Drosophila yakuba]|uniref:zinc finger CCCH domain-containing protein 13 n=1 Tax=Drosophila yakuba TaxID=7245 RepID=UPI00193076D0|nr:zinc finger CCCH domain-containing protein 13 [Drosophila yakuba]